MTVLLDSRVSEPCEASLTALGARVIRMPLDRCLPEPVSGHPDMLAAPLPDGSLLLSREYYEENRLFWEKTGIEVTVTDESLGARYPKDVLFNALAVGDILYGKDGAVSRFLLASYSRFVPVKQGYARCSVAMLSGHAAVTADKSLAEALRRNGIEVLTVSPGHIALSGYEYGFIGGAGGRLRDGVYVFFGNLLSHPEGESILQFCERQKISAVSLSDEPLSDHGGILVM